jgi:xanthine dehydrogenase iron-sulfur cluster and FAD-binding subunit A
MSVGGCNDRLVVTLSLTACLSITVGDVFLSVNTFATTMASGSMFDGASSSEAHSAKALLVAGSLLGPPPPPSLVAVSALLFLKRSAAERRSCLFFFFLAFSGPSAPSGGFL